MSDQLTKRTTCDKCIFWKNKQKFLLAPEHKIMLCTQEIIMKANPTHCTEVNKCLNKYKIIRTK